MARGADAADARRESPAAVRLRLDYSDERLRSECIVETRRVRGPGGQHRNKTESAVRLFHPASGFSVTGQERRSQHENVAAALRRLREQVAVHCRAPLESAYQWPDSVQIRDRRLRVSESNAGYFHVIGRVLDAIDAFEGDVQQAADWLQVTPSSLSRFICDHPKARQEANRLRALRGLKPLQP